MNAGPLFLGLDVGTQSTKALLFDPETGSVVARARATYGCIEDPNTGSIEQHPETWIEAVRAACAQLFEGRAKERERVEGIGVSGQQHGLVVLGEDDRVLRPAKLWCDTSTEAQARALSQRLGRAVPTGFTASKIAWLKECEPETWARTAHVLLPHDYVDLRLTGRHTTDAGDASGTGFFDVHARRFDARAMDLIDPELAARMPEIVAADALAGRLCASGAELVGLREGIAISAGSGDNMLSAIGAGATRPGIAVLSLGTSATIFSYSSRPLLDPEGAIASFCDATGAHLSLLCVMNATGVTEEVVRAFASDHASLAARAAAIEPGARGVVWLPYLQGERVPDLPRACGVIAGLRHGSLDAGLLYRAAVEGVAMNLELGLERMRALGLSIDRLRVVGGASKSALWRRILADALALPVQGLAEPESAALGAALQAVWAVRRAHGERVSADEIAQPLVRLEGEPLEPDAQQRFAYDEPRARFREWSRRAFGVDECRQ